MKARLAALALATLLAACGGGSPYRDPGAAAPAGKGKGGYYKDDGPAAQVPDNLGAIPDAEPRWEPLNRGTARPYVVFGKAYTPHTSLKPFRQRGVASWYGKKFHGQKTSSGEIYDMFAMTAAHTVLPIPSYVRVTNPANGRSVVVRINDRGPFHSDRIIDLSYTAAMKLGYVGRGSTEVEIEQIIPGESGGASYTQLAPPKKPDAPSAGEDELAALVARQELAADRSAPGFYLQLGAFGNPDNAENLRRHLSSELDWLTEGIRVYSAGQSGGEVVHRVQAGPFASRTAAEQAAERMRAAIGGEPALLSR